MINPSLSTLLEWAHSLLVDFPEQAPLILTDESDWKRWAAELTKTSYFSNSSIPNPNSFVEWRDWARQVFAILQ